MRWVVPVAMTLLAAACAEPEPATPVADEFVLPLTKQSLDQGLSATLVEASPSPPARGNNTWLIELSDADGNPVEDLTLKARLFMPQHRHGTSPTQVRATEVPGEYEVDRMNFIMGGVWEVRLYADTLAADREVFFYVSVPD
jgi:hypothetical protein